MIPIPPSRFVGRVRELTWLADADARDERLVTLLGPGGIGKTRLALRHLEQKRANAIFCDLSEASTLADWLELMCAALDVTLGPQAAQGDAVERLGHVIAMRGDLRVLLDNMEQLVDVAPKVLSTWRALAPDARFLVTSRERLRLQGEVVLDVDPLPRDSDGIALFHDRARAALGSWAPTVSDEHAIAAIVERLDGFPLAIELAATRCRLITPVELLARLETGLAVLDRGTRDGNPRHHTLASAVAWSVNTLLPVERAALGQCTVFRGGFTTVAAEAVLDGGPVLDVLQALVDKSLVTSRLIDGVRRFDLYASIREVASTVLDESARLAAEARHAAYYVVLGEELASQSGSNGRHALEAERDNLVVAHTRCALRGELAEFMARIALVLDEVFAWRGPLHANLSWLERALSATLPAALRGRLLEARGRNLGASGQSGEARAALEEALAIAIAEHDAVAEARARCSLCVLARRERQFDEAIRHGERALALCRELGRRRLEAHALGGLGAIALERGDLDEAVAMMERIRDIARAESDPWLEAMSLAYVGHAHHESGRFDDAAAAFDGSIAMLEATGDRRSAAVFALYRAMVEHERGDLEAARERYTASAEQLTTLAIPRFAGLGRACLGALLAQLRDRENATQTFEEARRLLDTTADPALQLALEIHRLHLLVTDESGAARATVAERKLVAGNDLVAQSDDVRFAMRILARALGTAKPETTDALLVAADGRWFQPPGAADRVSLFRNRALRRIMQAFAETRLTAPGRALGWEQVLALGWPGEQMLPTAGAHRVRVAISTLRSRGLRDVLLSRDDGYLLDPTVVVTLANN
jgi:predicted ATPase